MTRTHTHINKQTCTNKQTNTQVEVGSTVCVSWQLASDGRSVTDNDYIGVFECPEDQSAPVEVDGLLDVRLRGVSNSFRGQINWVLRPRLFSGSECVCVCVCVCAQ